MTQAALKLALEALERSDCLGYQANLKAITAIKEALAQEQEPVTENGMYRLGYHNGYGFGEAYGKANVPQRTWVGLNKEDAFELQVKHKDKPSSLSAAVENLLREKNQ